LRCLFDYLVGAAKHRGRHGEAERLGGIEVDHQFELGRISWRPFPSYRSTGVQIKKRPRRGLDKGRRSGRTLANRHEASSMHQYRDLGMRECLDRLAAEDNRGDAVAACPQSVNNGHRQPYSIIFPAAGFALNQSAA
jgi:hypothetical protein